MVVFSKDQVLSCRSRLSNWFCHCNPIVSNTGTVADISVKVVKPPTNPTSILLQNCLNLRVVLHLLPQAVANINFNWDVNDRAVTWDSLCIEGLEVETM
jgi:hypothetical protein